MWHRYILISAISVCLFTNVYSDTFTPRKDFKLHDAEEVLNTNHGGLAEELFVNTAKNLLDNPEVTSPEHPYYVDIINIISNEKGYISTLRDGIQRAINYIELQQGNQSYTPSQECMDDIETLTTSLPQMWSIQFFDAWGKPTPAITLGSVKWTGSYQQCMSLSSPTLNRTTANTTVPHTFIGKYCTLILGPPGKPSAGAIPGVGAAAYIQIGVCFPDSCSPVDIGYLSEFVWYELTKSVKTLVLTAQCQPTERDTITLSNAAIAMICILSFLGCFIVVGTAYDVIFYQPRLNRSTKTLHKVNEAYDEPPEREENGLADDTHLRVEDYTPIVQDHQTEEVKAEVNETLDFFCSLLLCFSIMRNGEKILNTSRSSASDLRAIHGIRFLSMTWVILGHVMVFQMGEIHFFCSLLLCFSIMRNGEKILNTSQSSASDLRAIHGIRFLSMTWVILGHVMAFPLAVLQNYGFLATLIKRFSFQAIIGATVSVDTFFLLSGTLTVYLALREMKAKEGPRHINWALYYFHRFWRLTPPYMLVLGTFVALFPYMGSGPFWPTTDINKPCHDSWWTNLLYINNLVKLDEQCFGWAWFLANDMQFYVITPLILIPLYFSGIAGTVVTLVIMLASFIATGVISSTHHYLPGMVGAISPLAKSPEFANYSQTNSFNDLYIPPYTRIGPYLVGVLLGYILYKTERRVKMPWPVAVIGWLIAAGLGIVCVYGLYGVTKGTASMSNEISALYNTTNRTAWGLAVAWVIFACLTGYGGFVNTLLSWSAIVPLSRLTYMAYLVHPIVIYSNMLQYQQPFIYTDYNIIYLFLANLTFSYMIAFVVSLSFEAPMMALEKLIFKRNR